MSYGRKTSKDANHDVIVAALERHGVEVKDTHAYDGFVDLVTAYQSVIRLVEVKNPTSKKKKADKYYTDGQKKLMEKFPVIFVESEQGAVEAHGIIYRPPND